MASERFLSPDCRRAAAHEGFSLPVVLMFLVVISLLATIGIRRASVGETLSRNQIDHEIARQAAEAALRDGERDLALVAPGLQAGAFCPRGAERPLIEATSTFNSTCVRGQCYLEESVYRNSNYQAGTSPQPWWPVAKNGQWDGGGTPKPQAVNSNCNFAGGVPLGTFTGAARLPAVRRQPEYLLELFPRGNRKIFRISARGYGTDLRTEVVLQTYYKPFEVTVTP